MCGVANGSGAPGSSFHGTAGGSGSKFGGSSETERRGPIAPFSGAMGGARRGREEGRASAPDPGPPGFGPLPPAARKTPRRPS